MSEELSYALITPYTIRKSRTGGVMARLLSRTDLDLVGAQILAPTKEFAERYAALVEKTVNKRDPKTAKLFSDPVRRQVLHLLTHKEMSASDIVKELGKNYSSVVYHLKLLEEAELITQVREEIVQKKVQIFYRAIAWSFHVSYYLNEAMIDDNEYMAWQEDLNNRLVDGLEGFSYQIPEGKRERVSELIRILYLHQKKEFEDRRSIRDPEIQFDPHVGKYLSHIVEDLRLISDETYEHALKELDDMLKITTRAHSNT